MKEIEDSIAEREFLSLQDRKRNAYHLSLRGHKPAMIAIALGVSVSTVRGYLKDYKEVVKEHVGQISRLDYASETLTRYEQMQSEAWTQYNNAKTDMSRQRWLLMVLRIEREQRTALQELGVVQKESERVEVTQTSTSVNLGIGMDLNRQQLDALAALALSSTMGISSEEAMSMRSRPLTLAEQAGDSFTTREDRELDRTPVYDVNIEDLDSDYQ